MSSSSIYSANNKAEFTNHISIKHHLSIVMSESYFEILKTFRQPGFVFPSLAFPLMFYIFFGIIFNRNGMSGQMPSYLMATYGVFGIMGPALFSFGVGVAMEKSQGWFDLKQSSPIPPSAYILARISLSMLFALLIIIELFTAGALMGDVRLAHSQWLLLTLVLMLGTIPFCAIGLYMGLSLKSQAAPAVVNLIYLPTSFLAGLWIPIQFFPAVLQSIAQFLPAYHLAQLSLKVINMDLGQNIIWHLLVLTAYTLLFGGLSLRAYYTLHAE